MLPRQPVPPKVKSAQSIISLKPKQSLQSIKSNKPISTSLPKRPSHTPAKAARRPATSSSPSSSKGRITNPSPSTKSLSDALSAIQILQDSAAEKRGKPLFATYYETPQPPMDSEPLDREIEWVLQWAKSPEGFWSYNNYFRAGITWYMAKAHDNYVWSNEYDAHVRQLVRVMDELRRTGECRIGNRIIRP
jgi:hypothetical protein